MKYKKLISIFVGLLVLIVAKEEIFAEQKLDRKQIYELRKECAQGALEFSQRVKLCDGKGTYKNHYNLKLNVCFIYMSASCDSDKGKDDQFWSETLIDINDNKDYGNYVGKVKIIDDKPAMCFVGNKQCKSLLEFQKLIKPYMTE
jgi:hypothetical protein